MPSPNQGIQYSIVKENARLDAKFSPHLPVDVKEPEAASGIGVHPDEDLELLLGGGFPLGQHEVRELVSGGGAGSIVKGVGKGVVGGEGVAEALLLSGPVKEAGGEGRVEEGAGTEDLSDEVWGDAAELAEVGEDGGAPAAVAAEGVEDVAGERGEAAIGSRN